jgi:ribosomal protein L18E
MTKTEYAKHCNLSKGRISQLSSDGKLVMVGKLVDAEKTDAYLATVLDNRGNPHTQRTDAQTTSGKASKQDYLTQKTQEAFWNAENKRLAAQQRAAELVEVQKVQQEAFNQARLFRDQLLNLPDRLSASLAAESDPIAVHAALSKELRNLLNDLAHYEDNLSYGH